MPFVALAVGVAVVLLLILGLKANAFLALLAAAICVALLSPNVPESVDQKGELVSAVARVADALGDKTGGIAVIIAMAAIIGTCMTESGAADRVVQAFLGVLGRKRAPYALMGSGFVLSVPVFFDTVFFLLVPLARSLYRLTERNYMLYLLAIAAGGVLTHTLVPPTPGPLVIADNLNINLGTMIFMGAVIAVPAALLGVPLSAMLARWTPVPFREVASPTVPEEPADPDGPAERGLALPSLPLALMPVILPVFLIGINTGVESALKADGGVGVPTYAYSAGVEDGSVENPGPKMLPAVVATTELTSLQSAHRVTSFIGNPSLALFIAAVASLWLLRRMRSLTFAEMASRVESSLEAAGVIILITAAGGAFGEMLKQAGVGAAIAEAAGGGGGGTGIGFTILFFAWGTAALMKVAQGSSTTAMITVSGIFAGVVVGTPDTPIDPFEVLGFHPVYLATAIGSGSLFGSWMSDSGFWIFTKMGGLTEKESLRTWTPLLALLSLVTFAATLVLAKLLPLG